MNKQIIMGRLGKDPELKTVGENTVANFSVAVDEVWYDKDKVKQKKTEWFDCAAWGKDADNIGKFFKKGDGIYVEGPTQTRTYEDKEGVKQYRKGVRVLHWEFPPGKAGEGKSGEPGGGRADDGPPAGGSDDDIPF